MNITYLGTGAAEGIPALFCHCNVCADARREGGKNIRTRSQVLINKDLLIDFGPDAFLHSLKYNIELADIYHCLITHAHDDHLYVNDLKARRRSRANLNPGTPKLIVYGGRGVEKVLQPNENGFVTKDNSIEFQLLKAFETYKIGEYNVTPLKAIHNTEEPFVYIINCEERYFLYGHDTDIFDEDTWDYLKDSGVVFNAISLDCTEGKKHIDYPGHMNFERIQIMCREMYERNLLNEHSKIIANHFSHNGLVNYNEAVEIGDRYGLIISYDGMQLEI